MGKEGGKKKQKTKKQKKREEIRLKLENREGKYIEKSQRICRLQCMRMFDHEWGYRWRIWVMQTKKIKEWEKNRERCERRTSIACCCVFIRYFTFGAVHMWAWHLLNHIYLNLACLGQVIK